VQWFRTEGHKIREHLRVGSPLRWRDPQSHVPSPPPFANEGFTCIARKITKAWRISLLLIKLLPSVINDFHIQSYKRCETNGENDQAEERLIKVFLHMTLTALP
jgi:hypothetical protein